MTLVASVLFYAVVCWGGGCTNRDKRKIEKLVQRSSSVLGCPLDSVEKVSEWSAAAKSKCRLVSVI